MQSKPPPSYSESVEVIVINEKNADDCTKADDLPQILSPSTGPPFPPQPFKGGSHSYPREGPQPTQNSEYSGTYVIPYNNRSRSKLDIDVYRLFKGNVV